MACADAGEPTAAIGRSLRLNTRELNYLCPLLGFDGLVDVFAATLPTLKFKPGVHVNYAETVLPMRDGLPKFKDFPAEFGGSGAQIAD